MSAGIAGARAGTGSTARTGRTGRTGTRTSAECAAGGEGRGRAATRRASELDHAVESLRAILGVVLVGLCSAALHALAQS